MHVILVYSYLQKCHLVPLADFQTYFFYLFIYRLTKHHSSILCWTYHMVYQHRNIMTLMYVFTHTYNIPFSTQQAAGNLPEELLNLSSFAPYIRVTIPFSILSAITNQSIIVFTHYPLLSSCPNFLIGHPETKNYWIPAKNMRE